MTTIDEQIKAIEKEIRETPYHKGTEHHIGKLRAKIARLKDRQIETNSKKGGGGGSYAVKKQGDATVVLVGHPSVGKSTLLNRLTNAKSKIAPYAFTTLTVVPGMMVYKEARIQILDVPGLIKGAAEGKGRGKEVLSVVRAADLVILMTDIKNLDFKEIDTTLYANGVRLNQIPPKVIIEKKISGGTILHSNIKQPLGKKAIEEIALEMGIKNAEITLEEAIDIDRLIDAFSPSRVYLPALYLVNKVDTQKPPKDANKIYVSAEKGTGLKELKKAIWEKLNFVKIYLVKKGEKPHKQSPIIMQKSQTLQDVAAKIGTNFASKRQKAKIWGPGAKYPGQEVSLTKGLEEGMQVTFLV